MKVLGIVPARGGSKGVPGKNIKLLGEKPLIAYTLEAAAASQLTRTIVSTDDEHIAQVAKEWGGDVPFIRPSDLATDLANSIGVVQHALRTMEELEGGQYDAVMLLQPTTPFRRTEDIDKALSILAETQADSVISVVDVEGHHPARMKFIKDGKLIDPEFCEAYENQPRQELETMYIRNGAIYLTKRDILLNNSFKGKDCRALVMPGNLSVNIDTAFDFDYAQWILDHYLS
ncbi:cytidylyltransferase domain-containing protein [Rufibacter quisquiliarum]|uniref:CMP-N-acetylneuraminic acid synthetase n=1 Tax=Rufibacter quisquiliarum TaxID=1549639 RepID=A0A839GN52_9BACT|nr:acylneuraminate cytidylyltransferase family protein [Rufibacter quisquiliarum]MBA9076975.1 CMP-N-acetylneuraminic acid synthetase [Rufibacter quisquiliarum]